YLCAAQPPRRQAAIFAPSAANLDLSHPFAGPPRAVARARVVFSPRSPAGSVGREPINSEWSADVRFGAHSGLKSDIAALPKCANIGNTSHLTLSSRPVLLVSDRQRFWSL